MLMREMMMTRWEASFDIDKKNAKKHEYVEWMQRKLKCHQKLCEYEDWRDSREERVKVSQEQRKR
jgi:hypothetical protein